MQSPPAKKTPTKKPAPAVAVKPKTFQEQLEKWFLPFLFVAIGSIILWTLVSAYMSRAK
jgi:hypothetical protein